jgi:hypothetical protein
MLNVGVSSSVEDLDAGTGPTVDAAASWEHWNELSRFARAGTFISAGHFAASYEADLLVNDVVVGAGGCNAAAPLPEGAILAQRHRLEADGSAGPLFVMTKRQAGFARPAGDWEYVVLKPSGELETRGAIATCARCHAEAPRDHLFCGPSARNAAPSTGPASPDDEKKPRN